MTRYKPKMLLSLLLALVMVVTMLPMTALAAEIDEIPAELATDEQSAEMLIEDETSVDEPVEEDDETPSEYVEAPSDGIVEEPVASPTDVSTSESAIEWEFDGDCGELFICGTGEAETFSSPDNQPWAAFRENIKAVYIDDCEGLSVKSLAYWFSGCTNLEYAEIAASVQEIGYHAFYDCKALHNLVFFHETTFPTLIQGAFVTNHPLEWATDYDPRLHITVMEDWMLDNICAYDWGVDGCPLTASIDESATPVRAYALTASVQAVAAASAVGYCSSCGKTCAYTVAYEQWTDSIHCIRHWCSNCGMDQCGGVNAGNHTYNSSGYCTLCGFYNADYDQTTVCNHTSTYITWSGCHWYEYCRNCGELVDSGVSHGTYVYGAWEYYNASRHRRYYYCSDCGEGSYQYGSHSTTTTYSPYNATQHTVSSYCSTCNTTLSSSKENHSFSYGFWQSYSATQHRRLKTCSQCGYSEYEYVNHTFNYGSWILYSSTQHWRTVSCNTCGYSTTETGAHTDANKNGYCDLCGYAMSVTVTWNASQNGGMVNGASTVTTSVVPGNYAQAPSYTPSKSGYTFKGWYTTATGSMPYNAAIVTGATTYYAQFEEIVVFSVTVPASLTLTVSEQGEVFAANNAAIINNSTDAVEVTGITVDGENGWTLVPYNYNMSAAKVNSKQIGFSINNAITTAHGSTEALPLSGSWTVNRGSSLPLAYDAVVSATSSAIVGEQVLTIVFVLEWADA